MLCPAGAEAITTQDGTARLGFEGNRVGLSALIANNIEAFPLCTAAAAALARPAKVGPARIATGFAALGVAQTSFAIIILLSFSKWKCGSTLGASDFHIWHNCLPRKPILKGGYDS